MASREDNVYMAKLSEQAERYDEMVEAVRVGARFAAQSPERERREMASVSVCAHERPSFSRFAPFPLAKLTPY